MNSKRSDDESGEKQPMSKAKKRLIVLGAILGVLLVGVLITIKRVHIAGDEIGVLESWAGGVDETPLRAKTYFFVPGWSKDVTKYHLGPRVFVMNNNPASVEDKAEGRAVDAYRVESKEGQPMDISLNVRWRLDDAKIIWIHKNIREDFEEKLIRPVVMRIVKDAATTRLAIEAYSGEGLVKLQTEIENNLKSPTGELRMSGAAVENFVIEKIELDPKYVDEIKARQVAMQHQLRAVEETKAAEADALKAKADAQSDYNKRVVEADRDKQVAILNAQQLAESQVISAKGKQTSAEAEAAAILALGTADAQAQKLKLSAYAAPGAQAFVQIEVSKNMAVAFQGIRGYLPSDMKINLLTDSFLKSVQSMMAVPPEAPASPTPGK